MESFRELGLFILTMEGERGWYVWCVGGVCGVCVCGVCGVYVLCVCV